MQSLRLAPNQPAERFYRGGTQIARFRRSAPTSPRTPEDWLASTNSLFGADDLGHTFLDDGRTLAAHIHEDPLAWLGAAHVARYGEDTGLLVKLLDAGERLPVHVHPDGEFSDRMLGLAHGKTEAWVVLGTATIHLGFSRDVSEEQLAGWVSGQRVEEMLANMNEFVAEVGTAILVPAGLPHAIGAGAFLVELQEPTDLSILLEWRDFAIDGRIDGHLGLGFDSALSAVDRSAWDADRVSTLVKVGQGDGSLLPRTADPFFRAERHTVAGGLRLHASYSVLVVTEGEARLVDERNNEMLLTAGDTVLTPFCVGGLLLTGSATVLRCLPPTAT